MKLTRRKKMVLFVAGLIGFVLYFLLSYNFPAYHYESSDRGMAEIEVPSKGRDLRMVEAQFEEYKQWKNDPTLQLHRTSKRIWHAPNLWWDNLTNRRWKLPYMPPSEKPAYNYHFQMRRDALVK